MMDKLIGQVVHRAYKILHRLAEGEMGVSYEAERVRGAGGPALVRVFHPAAITDPRAYSRYLMEAELVASLDHPHVVGVDDFGELQDGRPYVATELLAGEDLARRLERRGPLEARQVASLVAQVADALQVMHEQGILHRDLTPGRVFLVRGAPDQGLQVKVLDFGISRLRMNLRLTRQELSLEAMRFMTPEQVTGDAGMVTRRSDVFALAAIAYTALTNRPPFAAASAAALLDAISKAAPRPVTDLLPELSPDVYRVLSCGMARVTDERYAEATHLAEDLGAAISGQAPGHLGDWQPPAPTPAPASEPEPAPPAEPPRPLNLPPPVAAPPAPPDLEQPSIVLSPALQAYAEPTFHEAKTEQVHDTAILEVSADDRPTLRSPRKERITEEQNPPPLSEAEQKPATGFIAVEDLQRTRVDQPMVEHPATGILAVEQLVQQAAEPEEEKRTQEMSGPEILALQQEDAFMLEQQAAAHKPTVKIEPDPDEGKDEGAAGGQQVNMDLMKTVREPD